jgi:hypothetical protein
MIASYRKSGMNYQPVIIHADGRKETLYGDPLATKEAALKYARLLIHDKMNGARRNPPYGYGTHENPGASALYHSVGGGMNRFKASIRTHKGDMFADGGFKTKAAAKKWLNGYYSRGLLFGRSAFIADTKTDTIIFEKHY